MNHLAFNHMQLRMYGHTLYIIYSRYVDLSEVCRDGENKWAHVYVAHITLNFADLDFFEVT